MGIATELSLADFRALAEFRYQIRRFLHFSDRAARAAGLEPRQHQLLLALKGLPEDRPPTIGHLAERLQIEHHSAVELLDRLERRALVRRVRNREDRRQVIVELSARGEELLRRLSLSHRQQLRSAGPTLVRALTALLENTHSDPEAA